MRAFISYSLNDAEQFVLTVLASKLKEQGFIVSTSHNLFNNTLDYNTFTQLSKSNLFIGLITFTGNANERVFNEWKQATYRQIPSLLLVENNVDINQGILPQQNVVVFDRHNPEPSIELVKSKINSSRQNIQQKNDNTLAWLLGGIAAISLIALLSRNDEK
ncbi:MAG TPA: hypothetical protein PLW09_08480 [Candidatus Kapabacteria bacterium]|nr:hypothetical protein [Candidatus Kapabacteria bacterium]